MGVQTWANRDNNAAQKGPCCTWWMRSEPGMREQDRNKEKESVMYLTGLGLFDASLRKLQYTSPSRRCKAFLCVL